MFYFLKKHNAMAFSAVCIISFFAWFLQDTLLMNWDVSWDLLAAKRLAAGGTYSHDFFDLNPPLILYLLIPAHSIANVLSISTVVAFRMYVFGLAFLSLFFCYRLITPVFLKNNALLAYVFFLVLACTLLIVPLADFGQREHLLLIFTMPYFLAVIYQLQGNKIHPLYAAGTGLFAVAGFALKPHFLFSFVFIELYTMYFTRNAFSWFRVDALCIMAVLCAYLAFIFVFFPDYISKVVPMAQHFYYAGFKSSWFNILFNDALIFCYVAIIFFITQCKKNPYITPAFVLLLALVGFMMAYFTQQTDWIYHSLPAYCIALLMTSLLFGFFCIKHKKNISLIVLTGTLLFLIPYTYFPLVCTKRLNTTKEQKPLTTFLHTYAREQPVYFISASPKYIYPAVDYAESIYASRMLHLFWVPGMVQIERRRPLSRLEKRDERFFINMVSQDIEVKKPKFVFVDVKENKDFFQSHSFNYLPYLLKSHHFQVAWKHYRYLTTMTAPIQLEPSTIKDWDLYIVDDKQHIALEKMHNNSVVLTGAGPNRIVHFVMENQFVPVNDSIDYAHIRLSKQEALQLSKLNNNADEAVKAGNLTSQIINRAINFPAYKYQIYQRQDTTAMGVT